MRRRSEMSACRTADRCKKLRTLKTLIDPYCSEIPNEINDSSHVANVRVASSNLVSCSKQKIPVSFAVGDLLFVGHVGWSS